MGSLIGLTNGKPWVRAGRDEDFYRGKVATAQFFARQRLPLIGAERAIVEATDNSLMDLPESAF